MKNQSKDAANQPVNITEVQANHAQNTADFWYAELAPVSFFAPPVAQNVQTNPNELHVIPMNTAKGYCSA